MVDMVKQAANTSLLRLFPKFDEADDPNWSQVVKRAKSGDGAALTAVHYQGDNDKHPVCKSLLQFVAGGKKGLEIRKHFGASPYGWPQDAIDGSLYILLLSGHFKASNNGQPVTSTQLDRTGLRRPVNEFAGNGELAEAGFSAVRPDAGERGTKNYPPNCRRD